ncbi:hypothetical protein J4404_03095 [Candidatus Woesearchaeota archaeon]|nr:hypothetical protein [Candidatus Woesearchaeota archaeon]
MEKKDVKKIWRQKKNKEAENLLGYKCFFCHRTTNLVYHKKDGTKHRHDHTASFVLKDPTSFVRLCHPCHRAVHWMMENFKWSWNMINQNLK